MFYGFFHDYHINIIDKILHNVRVIRYYVIICCKYEYSDGKMRICPRDKKGKDPPPNSSSRESPPLSQLLSQSLPDRQGRQKPPKSAEIKHLCWIISRPALGPFVPLAAIGLGATNQRRVLQLF